MLDSHTPPESSTARRACCLDTSLLGITMSQFLSLHVTVPVSSQPLVCVARTGSRPTDYVGIKLA